MKCLLLLLLFSISSYAQTDTVYFNDVWIKIPNKENASFFRTLKASPMGGYDVSDYYISGVLQMSGRFISAESEVKNGKFIYYDSTGKITSTGRYKNDKREGEWKHYREDGANELWYVENFENNLLHGKFYSYYRNGKLKREVTYYEGKMRRGKMFAQSGEKLIFTNFVEPPKPPVSVKPYFFRNFVYPKELERSKVSGMLTMEFTVDTTGKLRDIKILESVHPRIDAEAIRIIANMPAWKPALIDDKPFDLAFRVPIQISE